VSTSLNSGVPLTLGGNTELASQFDKFTRRIFGPASEQQPVVAAKRGKLGLERFASLW